MKSICGADCVKCSMNTACRGCAQTEGCPFGRQCFIAACIRSGGAEAFDALRKTLIAEFNGLGIPGMPEITELYALNGGFVNLPYPLPSGEQVRLLDDHAIYLGNQVECASGNSTSDRCYGLVASPEFLLVSEYGPEGAAPEIVVYKRRTDCGGQI